MTLSKEMISESTKIFREKNLVSTSLLMRRLKLSFESAKYACDYIENRFPNLWREGRKNHEMP